MLSVLKWINIVLYDIPVFQFQWMQYFSKFLPFSLNYNEKIVSFAPGYMKDVADLLAVTDKRY